MFRRIIGWVVLTSLCFLVFLPGFVYASNPTPSLSLSPSHLSVNQNCQFSVNIYIDTAGQLTDGVDALLLYDPSRLSVISINKGFAFPTLLNSSFDNKTGKITVNGLIAPSKPLNGSGIVATINFKVLENAQPGSTQVNFDFDPNNKSKTSDSNIVKSSQLVDILDQVNNGSYNISTGLCPASSLSLNSTDSANPSVVPVLSITPHDNQKATALITIFASVMAFLGLLGAVFFNHH